jgi:DNA-binding CsgD family transcriptional regulator
MALTERQQQIVDLQKQGKKAKEIGEALGISENAVYQQLRRIRKGSDANGSASSQRASESTARRQSGGRRGSAAPTLQAATTTGGTTSAGLTPTAPAPKPMTPLQSVRARRDEVSADLKAAEADVQQAERALEAARKQRDKIAERLRPELAALDAAEAALQGKLSLPEAADEAVMAAGAEAAKIQAEKLNGDGQQAPEAPVEGEQAPQGEAAAASEPPKRRGGRRAQVARPSTQQEREASQEEFDADATEAEVAQQAAEEPQEAPASA